MDVFVNLPTEFGKSLIYQALPLVFDVARNSSSHIVVVISPLVNLMKDQVENPKKLGITAISLSYIQVGERGGGAGAKLSKRAISVLFINLQQGACFNTAYDWLFSKQ